MIRYPPNPAVDMLEAKNRSHLRTPGNRFLLLLVSLTFLQALAAPVAAQDPLDAEPIRYLSQPSDDAVAELIRTLPTSDNPPAYHPTSGWLPELLQRLQVPLDSQTLVFSKTSLQVHQISPTNPRALYFNDNVYVGYVPGGNVIELSAVDPQLGAVFYSIDQTDKDQLSIRRENHQCLSCHASAKTQSVPGFLTRSVYPTRSGHPAYALGTTTTDHTTPYTDRFGGWYLTTDWEASHRANAIVTDERARTDPKWKSLQVTSQSVPWSTDRYPSEESDLVALVVLEHQSQGHNVITAANWETRKALDYQKVMNQALDRPEDYQSDSTKRRIQRAADNIVDYLLFRDEAPLETPLPATAFRTQFESRGPWDSQRRSLRQFDGNDRLFRYPCSFLIYSDAFRALPDPVRALVLQRMVDILTSPDRVDGWEHLDHNLRLQMHDLLTETLPIYAQVARRSAQHDPNGSRTPTSSPTETGSHLRVPGR